MLVTASPCGSWLNDFQQHTLATGPSIDCSTVSLVNIDILPPARPPRSGEMESRTREAKDRSKDSGFRGRVGVVGVRAVWVSRAYYSFKLRLLRDKILKRPAGTHDCSPARRNSTSLRSRAARLDHYPRPSAHRSSTKSTSGYAEAVFHPLPRQQIEGSWGARSKQTKTWPPCSWRAALSNTLHRQSGLLRSDEVNAHASTFSPFSSPTPPYLGRSHRAAGGQWQRSLPPHRFKDQSVGWEKNVGCGVLHFRQSSGGEVSVKRRKDEVGLVGGSVRGKSEDFEFVGLWGWRMGQWPGLWAVDA